MMPAQPSPARKTFMKSHQIPSLLPLCLFLMFTSTINAQQAGLDEVEQSIVAWSEAHAEEAIDLIEKSVNINSGTLNRQGVREVGAMLRPELDALGFNTRWVDLPEDMQRGPHLFGKREGDKGKKLLLIGHLDTVFEPDDAFQTFKRDGSTATGPGAEDMKSGNVIIIYALKALQHAGVLEGAQIMVAYTGDEEDPGDPIQVTRKDLIEAGKWADVALGFESGVDREGREWATTARRSSTGWCLEVTGRQAHSSQIFKPKYGAGAIFEAARILNSFYEEVRGEEYLTFNAGTIMGGTETDGDCVRADGRVFGKTNVIPNRVVVRGGMRTISDEQMQRARKAMQEVVARHLPITDATISFTEGYPAMSPTDGNQALADMLSAINQQLGGQEMPILDVSLRGAADISFVAPYTDGLAGMGAYGDGGHTPDESLNLDSIPIAIQRAAILIYRLSR
ncbi:MAG: glutamate carboxypeptidase [Rhodothermales bacterium]|jgi:glutamate carboxypeptidase